MNKLPEWFLTNKYPAFYDKDSLTVVEQTAKVYGAMQEVINEHNNFIESVNATINNFTLKTEKDIGEFKTCISTLVQNYIKIIDEKIKQQDLYIKTHNMQNEEYVRGLVVEMMETEYNALLDEIIEEQNEILGGDV